MSATCIEFDEHLDDLRTRPERLLGRRGEFQPLDQRRDHDLALGDGNRFEATFFLGDPVVRVPVIDVVHRDPRHRVDERQRDAHIPDVAVDRGVPASPGDLHPAFGRPLT